MKLSRFGMGDLRRMLVTKEQMARAGGVRAAVEEALSLAALGITTRAMTAYDAVGMSPAEEDEVEIQVQVEIDGEEQLREAIEAGAQALVFVGVNRKDSRRLEEIAKQLRRDIRIVNSEKNEAQR